MAFGKSKNRRRQDAAQQKEAVKGAVRTHGPGLLKAILLTGLTFALVWGGIELRRWALSSPTFLLKETTFSGLQRATPGELLKLSGLTVGQNLWALDVGALERAMSTHPWVRSVEVRRHFPASVSVEVVEHVPAALAVLSDLYLLDEDGEPFKRLQPGDTLDLPLVTGLDREDYLADEAKTRERYRQALAVVDAYAATQPGKRERLSEVRVSPEGMVLVMADGMEVRMGEGETDAKLQRLSRVREELRARGLSAQVIHLENRARPGWVAVKLSSPVSERSGASQ
ncbi:cell division protein FtsQ/DivIB [Vitiosangium sp. GDMCC 1.1324]|uniref:cell division protein FtsQ/DivIB n=1 Tax=Vitiosangium sp. (strain GDMCC 1.1324) TaxID=2138576 RepID=UPI000D3AE8B1|nr:FtsQ-type POTRA domain-containing protein [Vitiosangium sp. GDMCC 1.1324]PTL77776.1 cell division protein FtsQ [Vitiosangium sp. GDMCC 1.1324]